MGIHLGGVLFLVFLLYPMFKIDIGAKTDVDAGRFRLGGIPGRRNIIVATGHGHLGLTGGPMTARLVAAMIFGERTNLDLAPYAFERFKTPRQARAASQAKPAVAGGTAR